MNDGEIIATLFVSLVAFIALLILYATVAPISGVWRRETEGDEEFIQFEQLGPFVTGKRNVDGGNHIYSGWQFFNRVRLVRKDFGLPALIAQGFPSVIAKKLNGTVVGRMRLRRRGSKMLEGVFTPQKILFDEASARVLSRQYQQPLRRGFQRTDLTELPNQKGSGVRQANLPAPPQVSKKRKTTF